MSDWFVANFNGSGTLAGYTPEIGTITAPLVDLLDGTIVQSSATGVLAGQELDGAGAVNYDYASTSQLSAILGLPDALVTDYYSEETWLLDPTVTQLDVYLPMRVSPMVTGGWPNGYNFFGPQFYFPGDGTIQVGRAYASNGGFHSDTAGYTSPSFGSGAQSFVLRAELIGTSYYFFVNGALVTSGPITDPDGNFITATGNLAAFQYLDGWDMADLGNIFLAKWLGAKSGPIPPGIFWMLRVATTEFDS